MKKKANRFCSLLLACPLHYSFPNLFSEHPHHHNVQVTHGDSLSLNTSQFLFKACQAFWTPLSFRTDSQETLSVKVLSRSKSACSKSEVEILLVSFLPSPSIENADIWWSQCSGWSLSTTHPPLFTNRSGRTPPLAGRQKGWKMLGLERNLNDTRQQRWCFC